MVKIIIKPSNIKYGIRHSEIRGYHNVNEDKTKIEIKTKHKKKKVKFKPGEIDEGDFDSRNPDRRGKKSDLTYRGDEPFYWRKDEFKPDEAGGRGIDSGFSRGGDFNPKPLPDKLYEAGKFGDTSDIEKPNPFRIKNRKNLLS